MTRTSARPGNRRLGSTVVEVDVLASVGKRWLNSDVNHSSNYSSSHGHTAVLLWVKLSYSMHIYVRCMYRHCIVSQCYFYMVVCTMLSYYLLWKVLTIPGIIITNGVEHCIIVVWCRIVWCGILYCIVMSCIAVFGIGMMVLCCIGTVIYCTLWSFLVWYLENVFHAPTALSNTITPTCCTM